MSSLKELQKRKVNLETLLKITGAMQAKSSSLFHKMEQALLEGLPYIQEVERMTRRLVRQTSFQKEIHEKSGKEGQVHFPFLIEGNGKEKRFFVVAFFSEEGLCGNINYLISQKVQRLLSYLSEQGKEVTFICYGKKGKDFFEKLPPHVSMRVLSRKQEEELTEAETLFLEAHYMEIRLEEFLKEDVFDVCLFVYDSFKSVLIQDVEIKQIFPLETFSLENKWDFLVKEEKKSLKVGTRRQKALLETLGVEERIKTPFEKFDIEKILASSKRPPFIYDYEPSSEFLLHDILPKYLEAFLYKVLLAQQISEALARMTSMDEASVNTKDMIHTLSKKYQKKRQEKVTNELLDIVAGV